MFRSSRNKDRQVTQERTAFDPQQLRRLLALTRPYRWQLGFGIAAVFIASALGLIFPQFVGQFFDSFIASNSTAQLDRVVLSLIVILLIQAIFNFFRGYLLAQVGEGVVADLRSNLFEHLMLLSVRFFESRKTGEITSRLTSDVAVVQSAVSQAVAQTVNQTMLLVGSIILLFITNFGLTLLMLVVVPVVIVAARILGRKLRQLSTKFQDLIAEANASAEEAIVGIRVVQSFTNEAWEAERYDRSIRKSYRLALIRAAFRAVFIAGISFTLFTGISVVLWFGGRLVFAGSLSAGDLVKFLLYTFFVAGAVGSLTGLYSQYQEVLGASKRIFELLDEKSDLIESDQPQSLTSVRGQMSFQDVSFSYGERDNQLVLANINLKVEAGEIIAIVGPSGAGKSTLVTLIPRFFDPSEGRVTLDGIDLRELQIKTLRSHIANVPQETQLFSGTIAENIRYGRHDASDQEVYEAARAANAHGFISSFPEAYETIVGERGIKLSGGQRQRVAIARAILKNPRILILDEATSSLDSESEAQVQDALEHLMQGRTTFVIAHRLSTIQHADRIIVIDDGHIVQEGSHEQLLARGGLYKQLYEQQFKRQDVTSLST